MSIDESSPSSSVSSAELATCIKVLSNFTENKYLSIESQEYESIRPLIQTLHRIDQRSIRKKWRQNKSAQIRSMDTKIKNSCLIRSGRTEKLQQLQLEHIVVPDGIVEVDSTKKNKDDYLSQRLVRPRRCYICKLKYRTLHFFYDSLCPACAKFNFEKRLQTTDLTNCVALVTGGRVKIGYRIVLKLLRSNCFVIATSRFPIDLLNRLNKEDDFEKWKYHVHIYGVDFRYSRLVELFAELLIETYDRLDFLINNACQTIRRPKEFYQHLISRERLTNYSLLPKDQQTILDRNLQFYERLLPSSNRLQDAASSSSLCLTLANHSNDIIEETSSNTSHISFDVNYQPIDLRSTNSWVLRLGDLSSTEINEVFTINTLAPFILNGKLKVLMADKHPDPASIKFIINVSAMEGSFSRPTKTDRHPHTNAAKAALNMMTRTSAIDYKKSNIYMVSVDTGWINDENPLEKAMRSLIHLDFQTPLDEEDAAARVLDPIIDTYRQLGEGRTDIDIPYGCFLKDYRMCDW